MKEFTITLTEKEVELIQISLSETGLEAELKADYLDRHNKTGINTASINAKREQKTNCDNLWQKLYDATKIQ